MSMSTFGRRVHAPRRLADVPRLELGRDAEAVGRIRLVRVLGEPDARRGNAWSTMRSSRSSVAIVMVSHEQPPLNGVSPG